MLTPEEMAKIQRQRTLSDAELIKEGASITPEGVIASATEEEVDDAEKEIRGEMVSKKSELSEKNSIQNTEGLGGEKNNLIFEYIITNNEEKILELIDQEDNKQLACEVVVGTLKENNNPYFLKNLLDKGINAHPEAMKALVVYTYKNHLQGERFWKNPFKNEILFIDDDGELISLQEAEVGKMSQGENKGMDYLKSGGKYKVLTGPNAGKTFDDSYEAGQRQDPLYRPIKGTGMEKVK